MVSSNDVQRLFLQAVMSRGILSTKLAQTLWEKCIDAVRAVKDDIEAPNTYNKESWTVFVKNINNSLDSLDLEFRQFYDEVTGREMYALVNRKGDDIAQIATDYSAVEITYFKAVVEQIMLAPRECYSVSSLAALREVNALKTNMSKTQAEVVLGSFVAKGWLLKSQRGRYSLASRTLNELSTYLKSTYPDEFLECTICFEIITRGIACPTPNCKTRMHFHCFSKFRSTMSTCPSCSKGWPGDAHSHPLVPVGEGAVKDGQDDGRRRVRRKNTVDESGEDEDEEMKDELDQSQSQSSHTQKAGKSKAKGKGKTKARQASMDEDEDDGEDEDKDDDDDERPPSGTQKRRGRR